MNELHREDICSGRGREIEICDICIACDTLCYTKPGNGSCYQVSGNIYGELYATMHEFHFVFAAAPKNVGQL